MIISERDKKVTAYHEAGHTLVARLIPDTDPVHKVTIIPRGRALGVTHQLPVEDRLNITKAFTLAKIAVLMGGRIAEELKFNELSTGAAHDIQTATTLARKVVCEWGMNDKLGPLYYGKKEEAIFLGREIVQHQDYSPKTAETIDEEVKALVLSQYNRARKMLERNIASLSALAKELLIAESVESDRIDEILRNNNAVGEISYLSQS
jgi:cell division protease FtsH